MVKPSILGPSASYSFSQYGTLPFDTADALGKIVKYKSSPNQRPYICLNLVKF